MKMTDVISNVKLSKTCSIRADKDSTESKNINLVIDFNGATLGGVFDKAVAGAVIAWQNGVGRKGFDNFRHNQTVEIKFVAPASKAQESPEDAFAREAQAAGVDLTDQAALAKYIISRMAAKVAKA